jgi:hypothetical protein
MVKNIRLGELFSSSFVYFNGKIIPSTKYKYRGNHMKNNVNLYNLYVLLSSELLQVPKTNNSSSKDYYQCVKEYLDTYITTIERLPDFDDVCRLIKVNIDEIKSLSQSILSAIEQYYLGYPSEAFKNLSIGIYKVEKYLHSFYRLGLSERETAFYRMRITKELGLKPKDMFHIPFKDRKKVKSYRFSIPGFPCLYLGGSLYVCWEELRRPEDPKEVQISRVDLKYNDIKMLDLSIRPPTLCSLIRKENWVAYTDDKRANLLTGVINYLIIWPLILATSFKVKTDNPKDSFKPEYIIPQLLLQWVRLYNNFDGICYFSTRIDLNKYPLADSYYRNYVFPVQTNRNEGHCSVLSQKFRITNPVFFRGFDKIEIRKDAHSDFLVTDFKMNEELLKELNSVDIK